VHAPVE
jgi:xanthine dehydrogenase YagT iron-sulfur-binding subunit